MIIMLTAKKRITLDLDPRILADVDAAAAGRKTSRSRFFSMKYRNLQQSSLVRNVFGSIIFSVWR